MASAIKSTATDRSLKELLDGLLLSQRQDIYAYSGGHLNESNLWKPPERANYSSWKSAKKDSVQSASSYFCRVSSVTETLLCIAVHTTLSHKPVIDVHGNVCAIIVPWNLYYINIHVIYFCFEQQIMKSILHPISKL